MSEYLGIESYLENPGRGVILSCWKTKGDIKKWKKNEHLLKSDMAEKKGFSNFSIRVY